MAIIDTLFMSKTAENHTLWGRTYLYSPYKGVPPGANLCSVIKMANDKDYLHILDPEGACWRHYDICL